METDQDTCVCGEEEEEMTEPIQCASCDDADAVCEVQLRGTGQTRFFCEDCAAAYLNAGAL